MREWVLHGLSGCKLVLQAILPAKAEHQESQIPPERQNIVSQILDLTHGSSQRTDASWGVGCRRKRRGKPEGKDLTKRFLEWGQGYEFLCGSVKLIKNHQHPPVFRAHLSGWLSSVCMCVLAQWCFTQQYLLGICSQYFLHILSFSFQLRKIRGVLQTHMPQCICDNSRSMSECGCNNRVTGTGRNTIVFGLYNSD